MITSTWSWMALEWILFCTVAGIFFVHLLVLPVPEVSPPGEEAEPKTPRRGGVSMRARRFMAMRR